MSAFDELVENRIAVIEAIRDAAVAVDELATPHVGPTDPDRIDYPAAQVLPENSTRSDANTWTHQIRLNMLFERGKAGVAYLTVLEYVKEAITNAIANLGDVPCVGVFVPQLIEDFAGELDNTLLLLVSVQFSVTTQVDVSDT
jgi:hypothetical protein